MISFKQFLENTEIQDAGAKYASMDARRKRIERLRRLKSKLASAGVEDKEGDLDAEVGDSERENR